MKEHDLWRETVGETDDSCLLLATAELGSIPALLKVDVSSTGITGHVPASLCLNSTLMPEAEAIEVVADCDKVTCCH